MKNVLAIDMGATSIRAILGRYENGRLEMQEVMRFSHKIQEKNGRKYWDWEGMLGEISRAILEHADEIESIGVDTWGVDFGMIDEAGQLVDVPHSYRDSLFSEGYESVLETVPAPELFRRTGNQLMAINTLFQWKTMQLREPEKEKAGRTLLLMPDLVNYFLTGKKTAERTIASTTQMVDLNAHAWNQELVREVGLDPDKLPELIENQTRVGSTADSLIPALHKTNIDVVSVAGHDTASAVYVTESYEKDDVLFLSSGTWSLMGCFTEHPVLTEEAFRYSLTNETGYGGRNMYFKNITGLYLIEKLIDALEARDGHHYSFDEIAELVRNAPAGRRIDADHSTLVQESGDFIAALDQYLLESGQQPVEKKTDYFRIIYDSLVETYASLRTYLEETTGRTFRGLHVMGGGSRSDLFNQMIADKLQLPVIAGPAEATALGNILAQLERLLGDEATGLRDIVQESFEAKKVKPCGLQEQGGKE